MHLFSFCTAVSCYPAEIAQNVSHEEMFPDVVKLKTPIVYRLLELTLNTLPTYGHVQNLSDCLLEEEDERLFDDSHHPPTRKFRLLAAKILFSFFANFIRNRSLFFRYLNTESCPGFSATCTEESFTAWIKMIYFG